MTGRSAREPLDATAFAAGANVSRETLRRLSSYIELLERWQLAINLVGRSTLADPWRRHVLDSAQLASFLKDRPGPLMDLGSGAGLPGLVLAIMGAADVHLIEADRRKAQFLREAARHLDLTNVTVHTARIETLKLKAAILTARALAPLPKLLELAAPMITPEVRLVLLKGRAAAEEIAAAERVWTMQVAMVPSLTDPEGSIVVLDEVRRRGA